MNIFLRFGRHFALTLSCDVNNLKYVGDSTHIQGWDNIKVLTLILNVDTVIPDLRSESWVIILWIKNK